MPREMHPNSLANLNPPWQAGQPQPRPGAKYVQRMIDRGEKLSPRAIALVGRVIDDAEGVEPLPISLRLKAAELIIEKTWPKASQGPSVTIEGATSLEVNFHFPGGDTKSNGHATISFDAEGG